jgi:suppressor for copper-sensitivity B
MIFALIGGAILNIMPCVLPVLSIKLISVINHLNADISRIRLAFLATISGILSCFLFFSFLAFLIKLTGNSLGWGLQFQNPYFLVFLILILTFFIANLLEIFEISFDQFLATILNKKIAKQESKKNIFIPNFLSGILAVLLATPCSAPFLGLAISFALVQSFAIIFLIFLIIGIGFSLPYIILFISPNLVYLLPKSGSWMKKTKHLMAILLALTAIWLIFILSNNVGNLTALLIAFFSASLLFILKIKSRFARTFVVFLILISSFALLSDAQNSQQNQSLQENEVLWQKFDETEINHLVVSGKVVLIDITADWCITCKFNKIHVLNNKEVTNKIRRGEIVAMRGDITKPNEEIMIFLRKHNRFAIPFNAVYGRSAPQGLLASELLSTHELLTLIEDAR